MTDPLSVAGSPIPIHHWSGTVPMHCIHIFYIFPSPRVFTTESDIFVLDLTQLESRHFYKTKSDTFYMIFFMISNVRLGNSHDQLFPLFCQNETAYIAIKQKARLQSPPKIYTVTLER